jgi:hypothetical protein
MTNQSRDVDMDGNRLATTAGADPGNTDPENLTSALDPDDDVYALIADEQRQLDAEQ